jgi:hypothetical protein
MPEVKRFLYQNGVTKGFDDKNNLIFEEVGGEMYWLEPSEFSSNEEAWSFLYNSYANPRKNSTYLLSKIMETQSYTELSENVLEISSEIEARSFTSSNARDIDEDVVTSEKKYLLKDFGIVYRVEGYTQAGKLKDLEHNFYSFSQDSVLYLKSSHYRNEEILAGYGISVLEISDIFYSDFKFETTL